MGTRNVTKSGFFLRKQVKRNFISWLLTLLRGEEERPIAWQPMLPCIRCGMQIEQIAAYCPCCGVYQLLWGEGTQKRPERQTEAMQHLASPTPTRQTEELRVKAETSEQRAIRIANEGQFLQRYLVEKRLYCWLYEEIRERYQDWEKLISRSKAQGFLQYPCLLQQLQERGATGLIAEFGSRCAVEKVTPWRSTFVREIPGQEVERNGRAN